MWRQRWTLRFRASSGQQCRCCIAVLIGVALLGGVCACASEEDADEDQSRVTKIDSIDERVAILQSMLDSIKSNLERINTWQGAFLLQDRQYLESGNAQELLDLIAEGSPTVTGALIRRDTGIIQFAYDAEADRVFTSYQLTKPIVFRDASTGESIYTANNTPVQRSILTPEHYLHMDPTLEYGRLRLAPNIEPSHGPVATREEISKAKVQQFAMVMDPRALFDCGIPFTQFFTHMIKALTEGEDRDGTLTEDEADFARRFVRVSRIESKNEDDLTYRISIGPIPERGIRQLQTLTVKRSAGFNVVQVTIFDGSRLVSQCDWKYRQTSDVFVPEYYRKMTSTSDGTHMAAERILELRESVLNEPIPQSMFSYANLGLKDGDRLEDRIENKVYVLKGEKLVSPVMDQSTTEVQIPYARYILIAANIGIVVAIVVFLLRKRTAV